MALRGGSIAVGATATALTGAINGKPFVRQVTFIAPQSNAGAVTVGDSTVDDDSHPGYFTLSPGASFTVSDVKEFQIDFTALYAISTAGTEYLQVVIVD